MSPLTEPASQPTSTAFGLVAVLVLVAANAFFVAAEFALVAARKTRLDEYGGTAGLVTMEDLLEEIVGPIFDEHDRGEHQREATADTSQGTLLPGAMAVDDFNRRFGAQLDESDYSTLGGFLFGQVGHLPVAGETVSIAGRVFEIVEMDGNRVTRVRLRRDRG